MHDDAITISPGPRFRTAMILAVIADALQIIVFPAFIEGAISPADDLLDLGIGAAMINLLGWHWEFLPSFLGKLVPGVDLVPCMDAGGANVYRKSKRMAETTARKPSGAPQTGRPATSLTSPGTAALRPSHPEAAESRAKRATPNEGPLHFCTRSLELRSASSLRRQAISRPDSSHPSP